MAFSRPLIFEEHLLRGVAPELDDNRADGHQLMDIDDGEDWSDGADSGYGSMTEDEEDLDVEDVSLEESAPSMSGLSYPTKRSREENHTEQVSMKRLRRNGEEESAPSVSGLSFFANGSSEDDYRNSAPSTSGLGFFAGRRHWPDAFGYRRWAEDGDSD
ncbi:uncharacterized protein LOC108901749 isoform X2 [Lates calcarifer]|uniref:Uncharacterized protein LOC108901749 isoform X2 n=1 Tax=Lates calcarifer TaxID=8187 RepID=A0AAJ7QLG3_LATCA|nr:uncharacterized protein LOC108901749 isoform X2 [Lates calcarifer]